MRLKAICGLMLIAAALVAGCGSDNDAEETLKTTTAPTMAAQSPAEKVIRAWADSHRSGDMKKASAYFAIPATVSNSGAPLKLRTRAEVEFFNTTLPCGAKVTDTEDIGGGFILTTFVLTERPGGGNCEGGTDNTAHVAIRVHKGKITDWRRANDVPSVPQEKA